MHSFALQLFYTHIHTTCLIYTYREFLFFIFCQSTPSQPKIQRSVSYDRLSEVFWQASHLCEPDVVTKSVLILPDVDQIEGFNCVCVCSVLCFHIGHCVEKGTKCTHSSTCYFLNPIAVTYTGESLEFSQQSAQYIKQEKEHTER